MKKLFIVADVHGFYDELRAALQKNGWDDNNPDHIFVSLGDMLDRGRQPAQILNFVNGLPNDRKILVRGNHELLMMDAIKRGYWGHFDGQNGTMQTAIDLMGAYDIKPVAMLNCAPWETYYKSLVPYAEVGNNIFVHGWIPVQYSFIRDKYFINDYWTMGDWVEASWLNGMRMWKEGAILPGKTIYCGHWHTSYGHSAIHKIGSEFGMDAIFTPFIDYGIVALDACTAYSGFVNCVTLEVESL